MLRNAFSRLSKQIDAWGETWHKANPNTSTPYIPNYELVLDRNFMRILTSFLFYLLALTLILGFIWPALFYVVVFLFGLHYIFSSDFLLYVLRNNQLLFPVYCAIIFQARCFNDNGLRIISKTDDLDNTYWASQFSKRQFYCIVLFLYFMVFSIVYLFFPTASILYSAEQAKSFLYEYFNASSFLAYFSNESMISSFKAGDIFAPFIAWAFIYLVSFIFGFNLLVPRNFIAGIQLFIWKRKW